MAKKMLCHADRSRGQWFFKFLDIYQINKINYVFIPSQNDH